MSRINSLVSVGIAKTGGDVEEPTTLVRGFQTLDSVVDSCPPTERRLVPDLTAYADDIEDLMRQSRLLRPFAAPVSPLNTPKATTPTRQSPDPVSSEQHSQKLKEPTLRLFPSPHPSIDESDATENSETRLAKSIPLVEATSSQSVHSGMIRKKKSENMQKKSERPHEVNVASRDVIADDRQDIPKAAKIGDKDDRMVAGSKSRPDKTPPSKENRSTATGSKPPQKESSSYKIPFKRHQQSEAHPQHYQASGTVYPDLSWKRRRDDENYENRSRMPPPIHITTIDHLAVTLVTTITTDKRKDIDESVDTDSVERRPLYCFCIFFVSIKRCSYSRYKLPYINFRGVSLLW